MGEIAVDKSDLLRRVIHELEQTRQQLEASYATARQAVLDTPHVMKSKREVSGIEASAHIVRERGSRTMWAYQQPFWMIRAGGAG
jgi:hypothetical protein